MTKRIILSLAMIVVTIAAVTSATVAYFTDVATSSNNTFTAGTLDIDFGTSSLPVNLNNFQPGIEQTVRFDVHNTGSLPVNLASYATGAWNDAGLDNNKFQVTKVEYYDGSGWQTIKTGNPIKGVVYYSPDGSNSNLLTLAAGDTEEFRLTVKLDEEAGDIYQGKIFTATINVGAKQTEPTSATWPVGF